MKPTTYKITYSQIFNGQVLTDSFNKTVTSIAELHETAKRIKTDPHVTHVSWERVDK